MHGQRRSFPPSRNGSGERLHENPLFGIDKTWLIDVNNGTRLVAHGVPARS